MALRVVDAASGPQPPRAALELERLSVVAGGAATIVGLVLLAAAVGGPRWAGLTSLGGVATRANAALGIALCGVAAMALSPERVTGWRRYVGLATAGLALFLGLATLLEHVAGLDLGIDHFLFDQAASPAGVTVTARMNVEGALSLCVSAAALLARELPGPRALGIARLLASLMLGSALLALLGYAYEIMPIERARVSETMPTALGVLALGVSLMVSRPTHGAISLLASDTPGGIMLRRLLLPALLVPAVLGWLRLIGERRRWYEPEVGAALMVLAVTCVFTFVVWWSAQSTSRIARARDRAEAARRALDQRIARLVEGISQGFLSFDRELRLTYVNARGEQMLRRSRRTMLGASAKTVFAGSLPDVAEATSRALAEVDTFEFEAHFPELERWLEVHLIPSADGMTVLCLDVSERRRREEERRELLESERAARAEAERANRIKDEFLATVSHELRTPLNAILGWSQILASERARPNDLPQGLATIRRNAQLQAQLIDDLLDVARIVNGKLRLELARTDVREVVEAAVASVRQAADGRGLTLEVVSSDTAVWVQGDAARLQQVVTNLLSNSIKFTPRGGAVRAHLVRMGAEVLVAVHDTGQGIEAELLPHIFERFRQADSSIRRKHGGLGLGLALVRSLVELHGGRVAVHSAGLGQGSTFEVRLPLLADAEHQATPPGGVEARRQLASAGRATLRGIRVLVVDDELDARLLARRILEEAGATVRVAGSAEEALSLIRQDVPHVLVTDIGMPDVDGYELVRRLRALEPQLGVVVPTVALTAFVRDVDRERARSIGFDAHIPKPLDPSELTSVIGQLAVVDFIPESPTGLDQPSRAS